MRTSGKNNITSLNNNNNSVVKFNIAQSDDEVYSNNNKRINRFNNILVNSNTMAKQISNNKNKINLMDKTREVLNRSSSNHYTPRQREFASTSNGKINHSRNNYNYNYHNDIHLSTNHSMSRSPRAGGVFKNKLDWKEKYEKIKINYDNIKSTLIKERQKVVELTKKIKKIKKKEEQFDEINQYNHTLLSQNKRVVVQLEESEMIRTEQAKLIRSLQREVDLLRGNYDCGGGNIIEGYRELRKNISEDNNISNTNEKQIKSKLKKKKSNVKSRSKSKNKLKDSQVKFAQGTKKRFSSGYY
jgi:hypothetical protein